MVIRIKGMTIKQIAMTATVAYIFLSYIGQNEIIDEHIQQMAMWLMLAVNFSLILLFPSYRQVNYHTLWYAGLLIVVFITCFYSPDISYALESTYSMMVTLLITFSISQIIRTSDDILILIKTFSLSSVILFVIIAYKGLLQVEERLGTTLFSNANIFAMLVMISVFCTIYLFFITKGLKCVFYFGCMGTQFYMLFLSAGRKYILVSIAFFLGIYLINNGINRIKTILKGAILGIGLCIVGYFIMMEIPEFYETIGYRFENTINSFLFGVRAVEESGDIVRMNMIHYGLQYFFEQPLFGLGQSGFAVRFMEDYGRMVYSHNNYVELLANLGIIGFLYYYCFLAYVYWRLIWQKRKNNKSIYNFFVVFLLAVLLLDFGIVSYYSQNLLQVFIAIAAKTALQKEGIYKNMKNREIIAA